MGTLPALPRHPRSAVIRAGWAGGPSATGREPALFGPGLRSPTVATRRGRSWPSAGASQRAPPERWAAPRRLARTLLC